MTIHPFFYFILTALAIWGRPEASFQSFQASAADSSLSQEWYLSNIKAYEAYENLSVSPNKEVIVAVIDTGVDYTHPDLAPAMWINEAERNGVPGFDDDGNGYVDDIYGINTYNGTCDPMDTSKSTYRGHGTHIAGTILRTANVTGVNPYQVKIMAIKAGDDYGNFSSNDVVEALRYAVDQGASVINMSFGSDRVTAGLKSALESAAQSSILVAAAGNKGFPTSESMYTNKIDIFPAGYPFVVGVMAHNSENNITGYSNWDYQENTMVEYELSAPGDLIYSANLGGSYQYMSGTSMSAAVTSGAAALLCVKYNKFDDYSPASLSGHLMTAGDAKSVFTDLYGNPHTFQRLDLYSLLNTTPSPNIAVTNIAISDSVELSDKNNGNEQLNPGETIALDVQLRNKRIDAKNISATLSSPDHSYECSIAIDSLKALTDVTCGTFIVTLPKQSGPYPLTLTLTYKNGCINEDDAYYTTHHPIAFTITDSDLKPPGLSIPLQGITFSAPTQTLKSGTSQQLLLSFIPADATDSRDVRFTSSNPSVAAVDENGTVTAGQKGTAVITVTVNHTFTASVTLYVTELPSPETPKEDAPDEPDQAVIKPTSLPSSSPTSLPTPLPNSLPTPVLTRIGKKSATCVTIRWNAASNADGYEIYRKTNASGTWKKIASLTSGRSVSYEDSRVSENKTYYYKIRSIGSDGYLNSSFSGSLKIALPKKITGLQMKRYKNKVRLTWGKNAVADGYQIFYMDKSSKSYVKWKTVKKTSLTITWNKKYKNSFFKVRGYSISSSGKTYGAFSTAFRIRK